jgi:hypothetical protein
MRNDSAGAQQERAIAVRVCYLRSSIDDVDIHSSCPRVRISM